MHMESSKSRRRYHNNRARCVSEDPEWYLLAFRLLGTKHEVQCHIGCVMNPAVERTYDGRSEAGLSLCISQHREESKPIETNVSLIQYSPASQIKTYPHRSVQSTCHIVLLLQSWAATKNLWKPELVHSTLHVGNLAL